MSIRDALRWQDQAACSGQDDFPFFDPEYAAEAQETCARCPVRDQCASFFEDEEFGVFGGTTPEERRQAGKGAGVPLPALLDMTEGRHEPAVELSEALAANFVRAYVEDEYAIEYIAGMFKVGVGRVRKSLVDSGVTIRPSNWSKADPRAEELAKLYESGLSIHSVAQKAGVNRKRVRAAMKARGVVARSTGSRTPRNLQDPAAVNAIKQLKSGTMRAKEIAEANGLKLSKVYDLTHGIKKGLY